MTEYSAVPCYLYVIQVASGPVKIGIALDVQARLDTLQTANYEDLRAVYSFKCQDAAQAQALETLLHQRYQSQHIRGEWYDVLPANVVADIEFAIRFAVLFQSVEAHRYKHVLTRPATRADQQRVQRLSEARTAARQFLAEHPEYLDKSLDEIVAFHHQTTGAAIGRTTFAHARNDIRNGVTNEDAEASGVKLAVDWLDANPDGWTLGLREAGQMIGVNKDTVSAAKKFIKQRDSQDVSPS